VDAGLVELMFAGQMEASLAQAKLLLNGRLHRINATVSEGQFSLDDARVEKIKQLVNLGRSVAVKKENFDTVKTRFLNGSPAEPFTPIRQVSS
jgi:hypothetical protein